MNSSQSETVTVWTDSGGLINFALYRPNDNGSTSRFYGKGRLGEAVLAFDPDEYDDVSSIMDRIRLRGPHKTFQLTINNIDTVTHEVIPPEPEENEGDL